MDRAEVMARSTGDSLSSARVASRSIFTLHALTAPMTYLPLADVVGKDIHQRARVSPFVD